MSERYYTQTGGNPDISMSLFMARPQLAEQVPSEVKSILDRPGIKQVLILYNHGLGERIDCYSTKMQGTEETS